MPHSTTGKYLNSPYGLIRSAKGRAIMNGQAATLVEPIAGKKLFRVRFHSSGRDYELPGEWLSDEPLKKKYQPGTESKLQMMSKR